MSIGHTLLESGPHHGCDPKRTFDEQFGHVRPLHSGQVCSTMSRTHAARGAAYCDREIVVRDGRSRDRERAA
ncbi:hypothetical protein [Streptomyces sp. NPDC005262]|uniref:hypothetical protein n=1 Tax=Streptomyces sp. NPDC005262 TaxID=3364710 RepID=UPI0036BD793C